jgi:hypothetical protein
MAARAYLGVQFCASSVPDELASLAVFGRVETCTAIGEVFVWSIIIIMLVY